MTDPVFTRVPMPQDAALVDPMTGRATPAFTHYLGYIERLSKQLSGNTVPKPEDLALARRLGRGDITAATVTSPVWDWTNHISVGSPSQTQINNSVIALDPFLRDVLGPAINARLDEIDAKLNELIAKVAGV
jgi:hypothetical protein